VKGQPSSGRGRVDRFAQRAQADPRFAQACDEFDQVAQRASEPIEFPHDDGVAAPSVGEELLSYWQLSAGGGDLPFADAFATVGTERIVLQFRASDRQWRPWACPSFHGVLAFVSRERHGRMVAAGQLRSPSGLRGETLIGLLASTGLRPGEALKLDVDDVGLVGGVLTVRESKFGKSRFVPLDESVRAAMAAYSTLRDTVRPGRDTPAFLVTARGSRLHGCAARPTFAKLGKTVGLPSMRGSSRGAEGRTIPSSRAGGTTQRLARVQAQAFELEVRFHLLASFP
jgi:hypothetical protein